MKVYVIKNDERIEKVFLNEDSAKKYADYKEDYFNCYEIEEHEVIE
jgi:hypothetical protein